MKRILSLLVAVLAVWSASARIELPEIIGDNMVLQQQAEVRLWGWAEPGAAVVVTASWGESRTANADASGRWEVRIATPEGGFAPQRIDFESGGERVSARHVLIGEVWLAGGQSNMEMPLRGFTQCPVAGANEIIARAGSKRDRIHYAKIEKAQASEPQERATGRWRAFSPATAPDCSATAYFFAELVGDVLGMPVGIVDCSWGGSRVESWMDRATLGRYPDIDLSAAGIEAQLHYLRPLVMYNAMLHPLEGYTIRGFLWYQGESNTPRYMDYAQRMADMVALWRARWGQGDLPFYYVEIAPYRYDHDFAPLLREAQWKARELIPNSALVSTNDLVEPYEGRNIHPKNKLGVGRRLAFLALNKTYGLREVACEGPEFRSMELRDGKAYLSFTNTGDGYNRFDDIRGFEICGADRVFRPAHAQIEGFRVVVSADEVPQPVAVRYCFRSFQPGNLANARELPVVPFRTDDF